MGLQFSSKIDWLSFVVRTAPNNDTYTPTKVPLKAMKHIGEEFGSDIANAMLHDAPAMKFGRAPYRWGFKSELSKAVLWYGGELQHMTVELSGQACEWARMLNYETTMLNNCGNLCSRIDIALDIECDLTPIEATDGLRDGRIKTRSVMESSSGTTVYLGSMKSEHYARIYRYSDPHPRAGLLRVEFVSRNKRAKNVCAAIIEQGTGGLLKQLWDEVGLPNYLEFDSYFQRVSLNENRPERDGHNTVSWLIKQAAPAFKRMVREGHIENSEQFLREYFMGFDVAE